MPDVDPTLKYVCGILAAGNIAQWARSALRDREHRKDLLAMLPVLARVEAALAEVKEILK